MSKKVNAQWEEFKFKEDVDYSVGEAVNATNKMFSYLKDKQTIIRPQKLKKRFVLSDDEISRYKNYFMNKHLTEDSVKVAMSCLSAIYREYDVSLEKALEVVEYAMVNGYLLSKAIKDKLGIDIVEIDDYSNDVLLHNVKFCIYKSFEFLKKIQKMFEKKGTSDND